MEGGNDTSGNGLKSGSAKRIKADASSVRDTIDKTRGKDNKAC